MKKILGVGLALFVILVGTLSFAGDWTGVITETHCGAAHKGGTEKDIECIKKCVASGEGKLALLVDNDIFTITNPEKATGHEGHKVSVAGMVDSQAMTVTIESMSMVS